MFLEWMSGGVRVGKMDLVNRSSTACALVGRPRLSLGSWRATTWDRRARFPGPWPQFDPLAPPIGSLRALAPGRAVIVGLVSPGQCNAVTDPLLPRRAVLTAPGGGVIRVDASAFRADAPAPTCGGVSGAPLATRFTPFVPQGPRSSHLPLSARIVSTGPPFLDGYGRPDRDVKPTVVAHAGRWLSFTVVLTNTSKHAFRFGRRCPAYTERFTKEEAYVLNCHAVGAIAPHASARFAMRIYVPKTADDMSGLLWTLAPHSYKPPEALAWAHVD